MPLPKLPATPNKEARYWAFEFPIALLVIVGTFVITLGIPHIISKSSDWWILWIGAVEGLAAIAVFYMTRLNVIRTIAAAAFAAGAIAFYMGLSAVY
jgi:hypothetical protein